ncbi:MAG: DUF4252 domain-containing protein [Melioribacteraceae bacterium]|nr:MAG: DUF4252 domain-containing protein [Melioribacteraceae bacterium]
MKRARVLIIVFSFLSLTLFNGCLGVNEEFRSLRNTIFSNTENKFEKEIEFSVGPAGLALAGMFVKFADDEEGRNVGEMIGEISRVQIGIYNNRGRFNNEIDFSFLKDINKQMNKNGWQYIVRAVDHNELAAVYIKTDESENLREAFIIAMNNDELIFANIYGDLNGLIETAIRQNGIHFQMADRN